MNKLPFARCVEVVERVLAGDSVRTIEAQGLAAKNTTDRITMEVGLWCEGHRPRVQREELVQLDVPSFYQTRRNRADIHLILDPVTQAIVGWWTGEDGVGELRRCLAPGGVVTWEPHPVAAAFSMRTAQSFPRSVETHRAWVALRAARWNYCTEVAPGKTPAVALGLAAAPWSLRDLVAAALGVGTEDPAPPAIERERTALRESVRAQVVTALLRLAHGDRMQLVEEVLDALGTVRPAPPAPPPAPAEVTTPPAPDRPTAEQVKRDHFAELLHSLCRVVARPTEDVKGRPSCPLADVVFALVWRAYSGKPMREVMPDLREWQRRGFVSTVPHFNTLIAYDKREETTSVLRALAKKSTAGASPGAAPETTPASHGRGRSRSYAAQTSYELCEAIAHNLCRLGTSSESALVASLPAPTPPDPPPRPPAVPVPPPVVTAKPAAPVVESPPPIAPVAVAPASPPPATPSAALGPCFCCGRAADATCARPRSSGSWCSACDDCLPSLKRFAPTCPRAAAAPPASAPTAPPLPPPVPIPPPVVTAKAPPAASAATPPPAPKRRKPGRPHKDRKATPATPPVRAKPAPAPTPPPVDDPPADADADDALPPQRDARTEEQLVKSVEGRIHQRARWMARAIAGTALEVDDLVAAGRLGALVAARRYEPDRGANFLTYADWQIRAHINRAIQNESRTIRVPVHLQDEAARVRRRGDADESPADFKSANRRIRVAQRALTSLDMPIGEKGTTLADLIPDGNASVLDGLVVASEQQAVRDAIADLPERERHVITQRLEDLTLREVGEGMGVGKERVRQIEADALRRLRKSLAPIAPATGQADGGT